MGSESNIYHLLKKFIKRKDDKKFEALTKDLICNLQINVDPLLQLCGEVIQSINEHWYLKYEKLQDKDLKEWLDENDLRIKEINKSMKYFNSLKGHKIKPGKYHYNMYFEEYDLIYIYNLNLYFIKPINRKLNKEEVLDELGFSKSNSFKTIKTFNKEEERQKSIGKLNNEEKNILKANLLTMNRFAAFLILCNRYKDDKDFNIFVGIADKYDFLNLNKSETDNLEKIYNKFYSAFKSDNSRKKSIK